VGIGGMHVGPDQRRVPAGVSARGGAIAAGRVLIGRRYQACVRAQWGQPTDVVTGASKAYPHSHVYSARSSVGPPCRRSLGEPSGSAPTGCSAP